MEYVFQEVHTHRGSPGDTTEIRVYASGHGTHEYVIYHGKGILPESTEIYFPENFYDWVNMTDIGRKIYYLNGRKLTPMKIGCQSSTIAWGSIATAMDVSLGNCKTVTPPYILQYDDPQKQQGNNPMRYDATSNSAVASITTIKSDEATQREYLLKRLETATRWEHMDPVISRLQEMFHLDAPKFPKTSQELLDAFKNGKFSVDQAKVDMNTKFAKDDGPCYDMDDDYVGSQFYGVTFTDLPVADRKGYIAAVEAYRKAQQDTRDTIMISTPADGLAALKSLESWTPAAPTVH